MPEGKATACTPPHMLTMLATFDFARDLEGKVLGPGVMGIIAAVVIKHGKYNRKQVTFKNYRKFLTNLR